VPFAMFELATLECKEGDLEERRLEGDGDNIKALWRDTSKKADRLLEDLFGAGECDFKSECSSYTSPSLRPLCSYLSHPRPVQVGLNRGRRC
jgi:hypothetical protein